MIEITKECSCCGAPLELSDDRKKLICLYCDSEFEIENNSLKEIERIKQLCYKVQMLDDVLMTGDMIVKMSNYDAILQKFEVEAETEIFLFCDTSILSNGNKGFLIAESGVFYRDGKKRHGKYSWEEFKTVPIKALPQWGDLVIDDLTYGVGEKYCLIVEKLLKEIKEEAVNMPTEEGVMKCLSCKGDLVLDDNKITAICPYCGRKYLLSEAELEIVRENTICMQPVKTDYLYKISEICANHKSVDELQQYLKLSRSMKKTWIHRRALKKIQKNFEVPIEDDCFMIYDATALGTLSMGFAVCSSGIYFKESNKKQVGNFTWKEFRNERIVADKHTLLIGDIMFDVLGEQRELLELKELLKQIQACL